MKMKRSDPDYQRFYGEEGAWLNTMHPEERDEHPTISTVTIHHQDTTIDGDDYVFYVNHVRGAHGKGFMPTAKFKHSLNSCVANGDVFYGTSIEAFGRAVQAGKELMERKQAELKHMLEERRRLLQG